MKLVLFTLAEQTFGMDVRQVREVIRAANVVPIPDVPPWIEGIIHLRGVVLTLVNLHEKLHIPRIEEVISGRVIVSHATHCRFGVLVDDVTGVITLDESNISPPDDVIRQAASVSAVAFIDGQLIPILDLERLLTPDDTKGIALPGSIEKSATDESKLVPAGNQEESA
ncbi:MAG: chemotaxis protein CheW [Bacteroidales bacterium]|nr:chemotaxis protein CheW [Bacteroidales bacterium]